MSNIYPMQVIKRTGKTEPVSFDKVIKRLNALCQGLETIDPISVAQKVIAQIYNNVHTYQLDELAAEICIGMSVENPEFGILASRIIISNNHKNTSPSFSEAMTILYNNLDVEGKSSPLVAKDFYEIVMKNRSKLNSIIDYTRDYNYDYFAFKTLEKAYLFKVEDRVVERIQHMVMRVSLGLHMNDINKAIESYQYMSQKYFTHATPTLFHAGTPRPALASCFLLGTDDSIEASAKNKGIYKTISDCAAISKWAGGIGVHISNIRSKGTRIRGTNGKSDGIIPMLKVYNDTAKYVNQCFTPETVIYSKTGIKEAKNIKEGDELLTKDGTFRKVMKVFKNEKEEEVVKYRIMSSLFPTRCTKQHQIFVLKSLAKLNNHGLVKEKLTKGEAKAEYVNAGDLTDKDYVVYPIPKYEEDVKEDDLFYFYLYGMCLMKTKVTDGIVSLEVGEHIIGDIKKFFEKRNVPYELEKRKIFKWKMEDDIFHHELKMHDNKKRLFPEYWNLPYEKCKSLIQGIFYRRNLEIRIRDYEKNFVSTIRYLTLRLGFLLRGVLKNGLYHIQYPKELDNKKNNRYFRHEDFLYCKIMKVKMVKFKGFVYDFNIDENHNYTTDSGLVHNSGKRPGSFAIYLEPHHPDILDFLDLRKNHGNEDLRARDLFLALWISDLFMERLREKRDWSLLDPDECKGLNEVYGEDYKKLYEKYESEGRAKKVIKAEFLWRKICESMIETGVPYILFKDHINRKSNQKNYGTIKSSNLCAEITLYSDQNEYSVCILSSIALGKFVNNNTEFDYKKLEEVTRIAVTNLNRIIDYNHYEVPETEYSNKKHRPIGLGVQGLQDVFFKMRAPFESERARQLNKNIFETIYYAAVKTSCEIAKIEGPYETFWESPMAKGEFQFDLWNVKPSDRYDWDALRKDVMKYGIRNSTLTALMPTASTAQILGSVEAFEPITSNIYRRTTMAGDFAMVNKYLVDDLIRMGLWSKDMKDMIIAANGSIQNIDGIPKEIKDLYKTVWEIKQKSIIEMAADRGPYICQTQSMNLFFEEPTPTILYSAAMLAWRLGLKTGSYYIRSRPKIQAQQFTIDPETIKKSQKRMGYKTLMNVLENPDTHDCCGA